ncbi:unnamed protein product [Amoebophrya sp. A120]|nr:unnamed protein product [Amoebophrya sp. A120]|eukprot:GSA120T00019485001.1
MRVVAKKSSRSLACSAIGATTMQHDSTTTFVQGFEPPGGASSSSPDDGGDEVTYLPFHQGEKGGETEASFSFDATGGAVPTDALAEEQEAGKMMNTAKNTNPALRGSVGAGVEQRSTASVNYSGQRTSEGVKTHEGREAGNAPETAFLEVEPEESDGGVVVTKRTRKEKGSSGSDNDGKDEAVSEEVMNRWSLFAAYNGVKEQFNRVFGPTTPEEEDPTGEPGKPGAEQQNEEKDEKKRKKKNKKDRKGAGNGNGEENPVKETPSSKAKSNDKDKAKSSDKDKAKSSDKDRAKSKAKSRGK